jgi:CTP synthase (UTP-ammonia lyase)
MLGLWPDIIVCRSSVHFDDSVRNQIVLFCSVAIHRVIQNIDFDYLDEVPLALERGRFSPFFFVRRAFVVSRSDLDWNYPAPE